MTDSGIANSGIENSGTARSDESSSRIAKSGVTKHRLTKRGWFWLLLITAVGMSLAIGSWPHSHAVGGVDQRVADLAQQIRCPTCQGLSVAESQSPLAQSSRDEIAQRVDQGQSDRQIKEYFVSRYGPSALMSPDRHGLAALPWWIPIAGAVVAFPIFGLVIRRWTRDATSTNGELTPSAVEHSTESTLLAAEHSAEVRSSTDGARNDAISERNWAIPRRFGVPLVAAIGVVAVTAMVAVAATQRSGGATITGSIAQNSAMLLGQARDQTSSGKAANALKTYDKVLVHDPKNPEALAYRGWLIRLAGLPNEGLQSIDASIAVDPLYPDAHFFRGYILWRDRQDPAAGSAEFRMFLADHPSPDMVPLVQSVLQQADAEAKSSPANK